MTLIKNYRWLVVLTSVAMLAIGTVTFAARPAPSPPPPPPPPAITYELQLVSGWNGYVFGMNEHGDMLGSITMDTGRTLCLYIAEFDILVDPSNLLSDEAASLWSITGLGGINNVGQLACVAKYLGETTDSLEQGKIYLCRMNWQQAGTIEPMFKIRWDSVGGGLINDSGVVCGTVRIGETNQYAFITSPIDDQPQFIFGEPGTPNTPSVSWCTGINNAGQTVGIVQGTQKTEGFLYTPGVAPVIIPGLTYGVNDNGVVVGYRSATTTSTKPKQTITYTQAFRYSNGVIESLGTTSKFATAINNDGDVIADFDSSYVYLNSTRAWVNLKSAGVVQGSAADLSVWIQADRDLQHINDDGVISGRFHATGQVFILRPITP